MTTLGDEGGNHHELDVVELVRRLVGEPRGGELWVGDDAAVISNEGERLLFASDVSVEGVHFDRQFVPLVDVGWRSLVQNLSDIAAMAGSPKAAVVSLVGAKRAEIPAIYDGIVAAGRAYGCDVVGGDLSDGPALVVSIAIVGHRGESDPVLRSGARPGDAIFVTGPLGAAAAGLALLQRDPNTRGERVEAFLRPQPRLSEGLAAGRIGATAMIDVSDGFGIDLHRLADASSVGFTVESVPVAEGATLEDALGGGEDYELVFTAPQAASVEAEFERSELSSPRRIGFIVEDPAVRDFGGEPLERAGYEHRL